MYSDWLFLLFSQAKSLAQINSKILFLDAGRKDSVIFLSVCLGHLKVHYRFTIV